MIALSAAVSAAAFIIAKSPLFQPFREKLKGEFLQQLFGCPFCLGTWFAMLAVLISQLRLVKVPIPYLNWVLELGISWLAITCLAGILSGVLAHFYQWDTRSIRRL